MKFSEKYNVPPTKAFVLGVACGVVTTLGASDIWGKKNIGYNLLDINNDGRKDIVINQSKGFSNDKKDYYLQNSDGSFVSYEDFKQSKKDSVENVYQIEMQKLDSIRQNQLEKLAQ